jgi:hypothetical protein
MVSRTSGVLGVPEVNAEDDAVPSIATARSCICCWLRWSATRAEDKGGDRPVLGDVMEGLKMDLDARLVASETLRFVRVGSAGDAVR